MQVKYPINIFWNNCIILFLCRVILPPIEPRDKYPFRRPKALPGLKRWQYGSI